MALRDMLQNMKDVVETPLNQPLDMEHVSLIVLVVLASIGFWTLILMKLHTAANAVFEG